MELGPHCLFDAKKMVDVLNKEQRHKNMSHIKCRNTKPEIDIRHSLHKLGFRYRVNVGKMPGKPDLVFPKYRSVIFINGCFWHLHGCSLSKIPESRHEWWLAKLSRNKQADLINQQELIKIGWRVLTVWECALRGTGKSRLESLNTVIEGIETWLKSQAILGEIKRP